MKKVGEARGDVRDITGAAYRQAVDKGVPEGGERRGLVARRAGGEGARDLVVLGNADEVQMGKLEPVEPNRGAGDIGGRVRQREAVKDRNDRKGRGETGHQKADVCRGARCPEDGRGRIRLAAREGSLASLNGRLGGGVVLYVPQRKGVKTGVVNRRAGSGEGANVAHDRDRVGGSKKEGGRPGGGRLNCEPPGPSTETSQGVLGEA